MCLQITDSTQGALRYVGVKEQRYGLAINIKDAIYDTLPCFEIFACANHGCVSQNGIRGPKVVFLAQVVDNYSATGQLANISKLSPPAHRRSLLTGCYRIARVAEAGEGSLLIFVTEYAVDLGCHFFLEERDNCTKQTYLIPVSDSMRMYTVAASDLFQVAYA